MRSPHKNVVRNGLLLVAGAEPDTATPIQIGSQRWHAWLAVNAGFVFETNAGHFSAQRETRRGIVYWYGYRRRGGKLFKTYLGKADQLTQECLEQASAHLAGHTSLARLPSKSGSTGLITVLPAAPANAAGASGASKAPPALLSLTKIKPPLLPANILTRPRLTRRIKTPVTLVYAPSGFGKSTLVNEWRQSCGMPVAWVSLDAHDDEPLRFWFTIGMALQAVNSGLGQAVLAPLRTCSPSDISQVAICLTNEIVRATDAPGSFQRIGLVLDDYHHIQHKEIHASIQTLLETLPPALQLVVSSRIRPPFVLGHLRARGLVTELETEDLRCTMDEGIGILYEYTRGWRLAHHEMQMLVKHTEGWVAGLHLATLALAKQSDGHQVISAFTGAHTYLREYFMETVLYRLPPALQSFLFKTAILKQLTGSLCDAVTGQIDGADVLARLWQENLFLAQLEVDGWYRYHDLFAEMLYSQLQLQLPADIPGLHRHAAEWYCAHGAPADAVYHFLAGQAWEEAASMIEDMALLELVESGEDSRLLRWLHQLPESVVQQNKTLLFAYVRLAGIALPQTEVERFLARVEANIMCKPPGERTPDEQDVLADIRRIYQIFATGRPAMAQLSSGGENDAVWQLLNGLLLYQPFCCQEIDRAEILAREVYEAAQAQHNLFVILMAGGGVATTALLQGRIQHSERIAHEVLQHALAQRGTLPEPASIALTVLSRVHYERNQLAQAQQFLLRAGEVDPNPMSSNGPIAAAIQQAKIESALGKGDSAQATLQAARALQARRPSGIWLDQELVAYQALLFLRQGDSGSAERILSEAVDTDNHALCALVQAEILFQQQQYAASEELLIRILRQYACGFYHEPAMGARILLAIALFEQQKVNQARRVMVEAARLAAPEGFIRPFLNQSSRIVPLLTLVMFTGNLTAEAHSFVKEILHMLGQANGSLTPLSKDELAALTTAASISVREQEVLRLVSAGLSNREIAARLSISDSTVKTHLFNIYRKLGVNSRTRATAQMHALKLV